MVWTQPSTQGERPSSAHPHPPHSAHAAPHSPSLSLSPIAGIRIGFISPAPELTPGTHSGMPYRMRELFQNRRADVTTILPDVPLGPIDAAIDSAAAVAFAAWPRARSAASFRVRALLQSLTESVPGLGARLSLHGVARRSRYVRDIARRSPCDVLFGCCVSPFLYSLDLPIPIVYFSDATARIINETYPDWQRRPRAYKRVCDETERTAMKRCAAAAFASETALTSAINDYGLDPARGHVVPMGANITPDPGMAINPEPPRDGRLRLCIVAADPLRKRLSLAIEATARLAARGWKAELVYIGPPTPHSTTSPVVINAGSLQLSDPAHRRRHQDILASSHLMLLPSIGEAYGIAPCEAAHFGRPSVVSAAGGLPTVVWHEQTGLVMPLAADAADYADAIDRLMRDPLRYLAMCQAAQRRAHEILSWDRWADSMARIIADVVNYPGARR